MNRSQAVALRVIVVVVATLAGFALLHPRMRAFETSSAHVLLRLVGGEGHSYVSQKTSIIVIPYHDTPFRAVITPSCSSLASAITIICLSTLAPTVSRLRRTAATAAAVGAIVVGNVLRIAASTIIGLWAGRASLVLFHDWVGGVMTFAYTLGGFVLLLYLLLPDRRSEATRLAALDVVLPATDPQPAPAEVVGGR